MTAPSLALALALVAAAEFAPARLLSGGLPPAPPNVTTWGWVALDVTVDAAGRPQRIDPVLGTAPFAEPVERAVAGWSFEPARDSETPVDSHVLVVVAYRAPVLLNDATATPPTVATGPATPAPVAITPPVYPPQALGDALVLVELLVDPEGAVSARRVVRSGGGFDGAALDAAARWRFRPARRAGAPVASYVYLGFGFRQPIVGSVKKSP